MASKKKHIKELMNWLNDRPEWVITAVNIMLRDSKAFDKSNIEKLAAICKREASSKLAKKSKINRKQFKTYFSPNPKSKALRLEAISNVKGINNLNPKSPLEFGTENLSIIYGRNGSGKSGYVRILKSACGAKTSENLLCNVFKGEEAQECTFQLNKSGKSSSIVWKPSEDLIEDLRTFDIFDTSSGFSYLHEENEATYEPPLMRFLSYLAEISNSVNTILTQEINNLTIAKPSLPNKFENLTEAAKYSQIGATVLFKDIFGDLKWNKSKASELDKVTKQLANADNSRVEDSINEQINSITKIVDKIQLEETGLRDSKFKVKEKLLSRISKKKKEVRAIGKLIKGQKIKSVPSELWLDMWESAREFSEQLAYTKSKFPNKQRCVLCQQELDREAKLRLKALEKFVQNKKNEELESLQAKLNEFDTNLEPAWESQLLSQYLKQSKIPEKLKKSVLARFKNLNSRRNSFISQKTTSKLVGLRKSNCKSALKNFLGLVKKELLELKESKTSSGSRKLQKRILGLQFEQWLCENKLDVNKFSKEQRKKERKKCLRTQNACVIQHRILPKNLHSPKALFHRVL